MKLIIIALCWKRYDIFEIFASIKKFGVDVYCGISEDKYKDICNRHGFNYIEVPNNPLGFKLNSFFQQLKTVDFDYVLLMNSNNVVCDDFFDPYIEQIEEGTDFVGFIDSYFYYKGQLKYWAGYKAGNVNYKYNRDNEPAGHGRLLSRVLIEQLNWMPSENNNQYNIDGILYRKIQKTVHTEHFFSLKERDIIHCGIKDDNNMHSIEQIEGDFIDIKPLTKLKEYKMIKEL